MRRILWDHLSSACMLAIFPLQDWVGLDEGAGCLNVFVLTRSDNYSAARKDLLSKAKSLLDENKAAKPFGRDFEILFDIDF